MLHSIPFDQNDYSVQPNGNHNQSLSYAEQLPKYNEVRRKARQEKNNLQ